jgi:hypothetical protein
MLRSWEAWTENKVLGVQMSEDRWRKLEVWELADNFAYNIYQVTKVFPKEEMYGITSQIRRAALSIPTNTCPIK